MSSPRRRPGSSKKDAAAAPKTCHIAIIGSGLGGISAALAIINMQNEKQSSADDATTTYQITIYERDKSFSDRKEGYGMTLTYDPNGPLQKLGVLEEISEELVKGVICVSQEVNFGRFYGRRSKQMM